MKKLFIILFSLYSSSLLAQWHHLEKVTRVTIRGEYLYVKGSNVTGRTCVDEANFYGTLNHSSSEPGHQEYYGLALTAYTTGQGMSCYIYSERSNGVCKMENCYIK